MTNLDCSPVVLWTDILAAAIDDGRLTLVWQDIAAADFHAPPLYSECLARLIDTRGVIRFPGEFIPHLEVEGSVPLVDQAVLDLTLNWLEANPNQVLGCNLSARNFDSPELWGQIMRRIRQRRALADRLVLEITETCPLRDIETARHWLNGARAMGVRIALDDFGAAFATSDVLTRLDVDIVKVDADYIDRPKDLARLVAVARGAAPIVVVEGVETAAHLDTALQAGASYVQGRFLRPETWPGLVRRRGV